MDHRRKALIEILALLEREGWAEPEAFPRLEIEEKGKKWFSRMNAILPILCLAAVATCFIVIGENHDLRKARGTTLSVLSVLLVGTQSGHDSHAEHLFVTIDGEWSWEGKPKPDPTSIAGGEIAVASPTSLTTRNIEMDARNILQLWHRREDGSVHLVGQSIVSRDHPDGSYFDVLISDINDPDGQYAVGLKIANNEGRTVASARAGTGD